jgi:hypothetical protein
MKKALSETMHTLSFTPSIPGFSKEETTYSLYRGYPSPFYQSFGTEEHLR